MGAAEYHAATRHTPHSVRAGGHSLDWANRPEPFKRYPDLEPLPLPAELLESNRPAVAVLSGGAHAIAPVPVNLDQLARLLFLSAGVTRHLHGVAMRAAASAGALYPIEVYAVCGAMADLPAGVYHFDPERFALNPLRRGDHRERLAAAAASPALASAPAALVLTGIPWRTTWKYRARGYRHLFWDAGTMLANLLAAADAAGLPTEVLAGFTDAQVSALLGLADDGVAQELPLAVVRLGHETGPAARAHEAPPLRLTVEPISARPIAYPLLTETHRAGELDGPAEIERWRERAADFGGLPAAAHVSPPETGSGDRLEAVVRRRGSSRRFARRPVPVEALTWSLAAATRPVATDFLDPGRTLLEHHLTVHAVEGVEPGAYRWSPQGLVRLAAGQFRENSAYLCLEQDLGGDAAYTVFHGCRLEPLLSSLGDRGYRAAQLEAGVTAGRLYLAAYTLGLGATSLTFYDDEVSEFFSTRVATMLVTAVGPPARSISRPASSKLSSTLVSPPASQRPASAVDNSPGGAYGAPQQRSPAAPLAGPAGNHPGR